MKPTNAQQCASNFNNYLPLDAQDVVQRTIYERVKLQMGIVWALSAGGWKGVVEMAVASCGDQ